MFSHLLTPFSALACHSHSSGDTIRNSGKLEFLGMTRNSGDTLRNFEVVRSRSSGLRVETSDARITAMPAEPHTKSRPRSCRP